MGFEVEVGIPAAVQLHQRPGIFAVELHKIAVEVEVAGVATEAVLLGTVLIGAGVGVAHQGPIYIKNGHHHHHQLLQQLLHGWVVGQFAGQAHAGIDALGLARVDAVVDKHHGFSGFTRRGRVETSIADHHLVQGPADVGAAHRIDPHPSRSLGQLLVPGDGFGMTAALVAVAFFVRCGLGVGMGKR